MVSGVLAALLGVVLTTWLTQFIRSSAIDHSRDTAQYSMQLALGRIDPTGSPDHTTTPAQYARATAFLKEAVGTGKYLGAAAWSSGHVVAYAVEPGRTGTVEKTRPEVDTALGGELTSLVVSKPPAAVTDPTEQRLLAKHGPLLEVYVPARYDGKVLATVVLYQQWRPVQQLIERETNQMFLLVCAGLAVLWLGLIGFVFSAARELRAKAKANWFLASHDALTGLPNRKLLGERVGQALSAAERSGRSVGLLLIDLDGFKEVNDTLGHHCGDLLLKEIGPRLSTMLRGADSVARLGGDEFVVLLPDLSGSQEAFAAAERVSQAFGEPFDVEGIMLDVEASIGVAVSPNHGTTFDALLQHADIGMYTAKRAGTGVAVHASDGVAFNAERLTMLSQLRHAVTDPDQFICRYQPRAKLVSGEVVGVEVQLLWNHPTEGLKPAGEFLAAAERTGLSCRLTELMLERALFDQQVWRAAGFSLDIALPVSTRCLHNSAFPDEVARRVHEPGSLELRIADAAFGLDPERTATELDRLAVSGVRFAISGASALSSAEYLKSMPIGVLTIDGSLVAGLTADPTDAAIVRSMISLGREVGLAVVAAGVDTATNWDLLTELGCDQAQGAFLARPLNADEIPGWLDERARRAADARDGRSLTH